MDGLPDADQDRLPLQGLDPGGADRPRPGTLHGPRAALRDGRHPGVAVVLLEEPAERAGVVPRARSVHSADEAEEHAPASAGRGAHHAPRGRVLRLSSPTRSLHTLTPDALTPALSGPLPQAGSDAP